MTRGAGAGAPVPGSAEPGPDAERAGIAYHRLATLRPEWASWSKPLLAVLATVIAYVVMASMLLVGSILALALLPGVNVALGITSGDPTSPLDVGLALGMGALWLPAGMVGVRFGGWRPLGPIWSVATRPRRDLVGQLGLWAVVAGVAAVALAAVVGMVTASPDLAESLATEESSIRPAQLFLVLAIALVLGPVQAVGLELTFRGVLLQALGTWMRSPLLPILLVAAVTVIGREMTAAVLIPAVALALSTAVLAWKSGGLELSILLTTTMTVGSVASAALGSGTGAGAGTAALVGASAAPGTAAAGLNAADETAALAGGIAAAVVLLVLTAVLVGMISRRYGIGLLHPVTRPVAEPAPHAVPH